MSKKKLQEKVQELVSLREMAAELADEIEALTDEIKADMDLQGVDTLEAGKHTIRWAVVKFSWICREAINQSGESGKDHA